MVTALSRTLLRSIQVSEHVVVRRSASVYCIQPFSTAATTKKYGWAETEMPPPSPGRGYLGRSANFDVTEREGQYDRWSWLFKLLGYMNEDDRLFTDSNCVFQSCVNQSSQRNFYQALQLTPTFRGQQALLLAHVWLVHRRFSLEGEQGKIMQELMFDRLWEETVVRIRYMNVSELTVNKHLAEVQQLCFNTCIAYDRGLQDSPSALQTAVAKHLLENESVESQRLAGKMVEYMKREFKTLEKVDAKWGKSKKTFYSADTADFEYEEDETAAQDEEAAAVEIQRRQEARLKNEDFGIDDEETEEEEEEMVEDEEELLDTQLADISLLVDTSDRTAIEQIPKDFSKLSKKDKLQIVNQYVYLSSYSSLDI